MSDHVESINVVPSESPEVAFEEPVSLETAKLQCRIEPSETLEDSYLSSLITAAREVSETIVKRPLALTTYRMVLTRLPLELVIPTPSLRDVLFVTYLDADGMVTTLSSSKYRIVPKGKQPSRLVFSDLPVMAAPYVIRYRAGGCPASAWAAMLLLISHWYRQREAASEKSYKDVPMGVRTLLSHSNWGQYA